MWHPVLSFFAQPYSQYISHITSGQAEHPTRKSVSQHCTVRNSLLLPANYFILSVYFGFKSLTFSAFRLVYSAPRNATAHCLKSQQFNDHRNTNLVHGSLEAYAPVFHKPWMLLVGSGAPARFQARVGKHMFDKIRREAPKKFFRLPTLAFSLPTLPYVAVAHPAHSGTLVPT